MNKAQAIHSFWSGFGIPAYDETTVPDDAQMPYITYNVVTGALDDALLMSGSIWYRDTSWATVTAKADEIADALYTTIPIDGGGVYLTQGTPFAQRMSDPADDSIRRIYINLSAEFITLT